MVINAVRLAPLLNRHLPMSAGTFSIPDATRVAAIQAVTLRGILLKKQRTTWDQRALRSRVSIGRRGGQYTLEDDGSLVLCVGVKNLQPDVTCRIEDGLPWLSLINKSVGKRLSVAGFLWCSFATTNNAHIFEIRPVSVLRIDDEMHSLEPGIATTRVHDWTADLNRVDEARQVRFWKGSDTLVFNNVEREKQTYVRVVGNASDLTLNVATNRPAWFILTSAHVARQVKVTCLQGTRAARQIRNRNSESIAVIGLRSIDLARCLEERYRINLLAVDIRKP